MNIEAIEAPADLRGAFAPAATISQINPDRRERLENLYISNYAEIRDIASSEPSLFIGDIENLTDSIATHLDSYDGPDDDSAAFLRWAQEILTPALKSLTTFYTMRDEHRDYVREAIGSVLKNSEGLGTTDALDEIENGV